MQKKVHFIGIGGIGVSALAQYYLSKGVEVSGSDLASSEITEFLKAKSIKIIIGNYPENINKDLDLVVYSPAVPKDNPELLAAKSHKIKTISYPEALGEITKEYFTIAIAGSHGKSTTTAMASLVLEKAGFDPTVIVGTKIKEFGDSNFREGKSKFLIIEACEYDSSFLCYSPKIIIVTNVDKEHLDYFKNLKNIKKAFKDFILQLPEDGIFIFNKEDKNTPGIKAKVKKIGFSLKSKNALRLKNILKVPGEHNVANALAVFEMAKVLNISDDVYFDAISKFTGTWRRFELKEGRAGEKNFTVVSDYGHHPNEVLATLTAAREKFPNKKIWCIFQPHQHQRTFYLFKDFVKTFKKVSIDKIIITDIYDVAGRETKKINNKISSEKLVQKINKKNIVYLPQADLQQHINKNIEEENVLIIMGAGDIYKLADNFI